MNKIFLSAVIVAMLTGCDTGGDTYIAPEQPLAPGEPSTSSDTIVSAEADNGSTAVIQYTPVSDGSINMSCGDDCTLTVYEATKIEDEDNETKEDEDNETKEEE